MKRTYQTLAFLIVLSGFIALIIISCKKEKNSNTSPSSPCPTTSACGCSAKNKAECDASTQCCKWTTGQGCGCK